MPLRSPVKSVARVLNTPHFYVVFTLAVVIFWGISFGVSFAIVRSSRSPDERFLFSVWIFLEILLWGISFAVFSFSTSRAVRNRIIYGHQRPLLRSAVTTDNVFIRIFFFSFGVNCWWKRFLAHTANILMVPCPIVIGVLGIACVGVRSGNSTGHCLLVNPYGNAAVSTSCRAVLLGAAYAMNYVGCHNSQQPEFENVPNQAGGRGVIGEVYGRPPQSSDAAEGIPKDTRGPNGDGALPAAASCGGAPVGGVLTQIVTCRAAADPPHSAYSPREAAAADREVSDPRAPASACAAGGECPSREAKDGAEKGTSKQRTTSCGPPHTHGGGCEGGHSAVGGGCGGGSPIIVEGVPLDRHGSPMPMMVAHGELHENGNIYRAASPADVSLIFSGTPPPQPQQAGRKEGQTTAAKPFESSQGAIAPLTSSARPLGPPMHGSTSQHTRRGAVAGSPKSRRRGAGFHHQVSSPVADDGSLGGDEMSHAADDSITCNTACALEAELPRRSHAHATVNIPSAAAPERGGKVVDVDSGGPRSTSHTAHSSACSRGGGGDTDKAANDKEDTAQQLWTASAGVCPVPEDPTPGKYTGTSDTLQSALSTAGASPLGPLHRSRSRSPSHGHTPIGEEGPEIAASESSPHQVQGCGDPNEAPPLQHTASSVTFNAADEEDLLAAVETADSGTAKTD